MLRQLPRLALAASLTAVGCFSEAPLGGTTAGTDASESEGTTTAGTGASGDTTAAGTDQSTSGTAASASASESGETTEGTDTGSETTEGTASGSDSSSDSGIPVPTVCPTFFDAFDDGVKDPLWRQSFPASASEVDDELVITVTGAADDEYVTMVVLPEGGGLAGGTMRVELGTTPVEVGVRTTLWVQPLAGAGRISYNLASRSGGLRLEARITPELGSPYVDATIDWNPASMLWLQLREADGTLYFETSTDGEMFEPFHDMPVPFDVSPAEVGFAGHNDLMLPNDVEVSVRTFEFICG